MHSIEEKKTRVVNINYELCEVYIGRPSMFGNPFPISREITRDEAILKFAAYFERRIKEDKEFRDAVHSLKGKVLGCYCKPKACHGDYIASYLDNRSKL